jgi:hypothetical protein
LRDAGRADFPEPGRPASPLGKRGGYRVGAQLEILAHDMTAAFMSH